jgi:F420-0:gamma-glutamyl ligase-like protein
VRHQNVSRNSHAEPACWPEVDVREDAVQVLISRSDGRFAVNAYSGHGVDIGQAPGDYGSFPEAWFGAQSMADGLREQYGMAITAIQVSEVCNDLQALRDYDRRYLRIGKTRTAMSRRRRALRRKR